MVNAIENNVDLDPVAAVDTAGGGFIKGVDLIFDKPANLKKASKFLIAWLKASDYFFKERLPFVISNNIPHAIDKLGFLPQVLDFYATFKNVVYWVNPIDKDSVDSLKTKKEMQDKLKKIEEAILAADPKSKLAGSNSIKNHKVTPLSNSEIQIIEPEEPASLKGKVKKIESYEDKASRIYNSIFDKNQKYLTKQGVHKALKNKLIEEYKDYLGIQLDLFDEKKTIAGKINDIAGEHIVFQKKRSKLEIAHTILFTGINITTNVLTLNRWGVLDLANIAKEIGTKVPVLSFVAHVTIVPLIETVLGGVVSVALLLVIIDQAVKLHKARLKASFSKDLHETLKKAQMQIELLKGKSEDLTQLGETQTAFEKTQQELVQLLQKMKVETESDEKLRTALNAVLEQVNSQALENIDVDVIQKAVDQAQKARMESVKKRTQMIWDLSVTCMDFTATFIPFVLTLAGVPAAPVVSIVLGVAAKSFGMVAVFARPS